MSPRHHLDPATVVAYAAGAVTPEFAAVVATHLASCATCRRRLAGAERVGGLLLEQQQPAVAIEQQRSAQLREAMLQRLADSEALPGVHDPADETEPPITVEPDRLPLPLQPYFGTRFSALKWRWLGPGIRCIHAHGSQSLVLLKVAPGRSLPMHTHQGQEITQILRGAYYDELGHFSQGDVADLDSDIEHRPVAARGIACICVCALDAPVRFSSRLMQALQPLFRL